MPDLRDPSYAEATKAAREAEQARAVRLARFTALRAVGWAKLTAAEQAEARGLAFELGLYAPG